MQDLISIIIPVYNVRKEHLSRCVDSVLAQTYSLLEILLIDDGSTDPSILPILQAFQDKDTRIKLIHKENEGVVATRQRGIDIASGNYLFFLDCDDFITTDAIQLLYHKAIEAQASIIIGDHWLLYENGVKKLAHQQIAENSNYIKSLLIGSCNGTLWGKLFKREVFSIINLLSEGEKKRDNDVQMNFLIAGKIASKEIVCLGVPVYYWLQRNDSATRHQVKEKDVSGFYQLMWINHFVANNFNPHDLKDELAVRNLRTWALFLSWDLSCPEPALRTDIYQKYWKNKQAKKYLSTTQKILIYSNHYALSKYSYKLYNHWIKPFVKRHFLKFYLHHT